VPSALDAAKLAQVSRAKQRAVDCSNIQHLSH